MKLIVASALALMIAAAATAAAQEKGTWEFGSDAGLGVSFVPEIEGVPLYEGGPIVGAADSRTDFHASLPGSGWRIGYFVSRSLSIELPLVFGYTNYGGGRAGLESTYAFSSGLGLIYNTGRGLFVGVNGTFSISDVSYSDESRYGDPSARKLYALGANLGLRRRVFADNIRFRVSLDYSHAFEEDRPDTFPYAQPATDTLGLVFGISLLI